MFVPARLRTLFEVSHIRANEGVPVPLSNRMRVEVHRCGLINFISDCAFDPMSAIFAFASAGETDWQHLIVYGSSCMTSRLWISFLSLSGSRNF